MLDVKFGKDRCYVHKDNSQQNVSLPKKIVFNLIRTCTAKQPKATLRLKRKAAAWNDDL